MGVEGPGGPGDGTVKEGEPILPESPENKAYERDLSTPGGTIPAGGTDPTKIQDPALKEVNRAAAEYDAYYDSYEVGGPTRVMPRDALRSVQAEPPIVRSFFRPLLDLLRGFEKPKPWMREAFRPGVDVLYEGKTVEVVSVERDRFRYRTVENVNGRCMRVQKTAPLTDRLIVDNFADLPVEKIRPTENGLSALRLANASQYADEPIWVARVPRRTVPSTITPSTGITGFSRPTSPDRRACTFSSSTSMRNPSETN